MDASRHGRHGDDADDEDEDEDEGDDDPDWAPPMGADGDPLLDDDGASEADSHDEAEEEDNAADEAELVSKPPPKRRGRKPNPNSIAGAKREAQEANRQLLSTNDARIRQRVRDYFEKEGMLAPEDAVVAADQLARLRRAPAQLPELTTSKDGQPHRVLRRSLQVRGVSWAMVLEDESAYVLSLFSVGRKCWRWAQRRGMDFWSPGRLTFGCRG